MADLPASALAEWQAWFSIDGPEIAADRRAGKTCAAVANFGGMTVPNNPVLPSQFFPSLAEEDKPEERPPQSAEEIEAAFAGLADRTNRRAARERKRKIGDGHDR